MRNKTLAEIPSPIDIFINPPPNCVELTIYDDDGPEGYYERWRFKRSSDAVKMLLECFTEDTVGGFNFEIKNHWKYDSSGKPL